MSKRYIVVPHPATVKTPQGTFIVPWGGVDGFADIFFRDARIQQVIDYDERKRIRAAWMAASKADVIENEETPWMKLAELAKNPHSLSPAFLDSEGGIAMLDAIRNASTKPPKK